MQLHWLQEEPFFATYNSNNVNKNRKASEELLEKFKRVTNFQFSEELSVIICNFLFNDVSLRWIKNPHPFLSLNQSATDQGKCAPYVYNSTICHHKKKGRLLAMELINKKDYWKFEGRIERHDWLVETKEKINLASEWKGGSDIPRVIHAWNHRRDIWRECSG